MNIQYKQVYDELDKLINLAYDIYYDKFRYLQCESDILLKVIEKISKSKYELAAEIRDSVEFNQTKWNTIIEVYRSEISNLNNKISEFIARII